MSRRVLFAVMLLTLTSCRKKWTGTYSGPLSQFVTLPAPGPSKSQTIPDNGSADVVVTDGSDGEVTFDYRGCRFSGKVGTVAADATTLVAIARTIDCTFPSTDVAVHVTSASITLTGNQLSWTWTGDAHKGDVQGSFGSTFTGNRAAQ